MNRRDALGLHVLREDPIPLSEKRVTLAVDPDELELCTTCGCKLSIYRGRDDYLCKPCKLLHECTDCVGTGRSRRGSGTQRCSSCSGTGVCL